MAVDIRSVLIPVTGERILLPNATVAEVITYAAPDAVEGTPDWVLGRVVWRGWRVPVFSLPMLAGWSAGENEAGAKIAILKALGGNPDMPFMAMVTQGFPRLVTVTADSMEILDGETAGSGEPAPGDLDEVEEAPASAETGEFPDDEEPDLEDFSVEMEYGEIEGGHADETRTGPETPAVEPESEMEPAPAAEASPDDETTAGAGGAGNGLDPTTAVVRVAGERAVIPDLVPIERRVAEAIGPEILKSHRR